MWDLGNRGAVVLISALSGCAFIYNAWGPILVLTVSLFLVLYACYSLIVNDSLLSPHALLAFDYAREAARELRGTLETTCVQATRYIREYWITAKRHYRERFPTRMERRRMSNYQLSSDSCPSTRSSSRFSLIEQLSPIPRNTHKGARKDGQAENRLYEEADSRLFNHGGSFSKHTSTPMVPKKSDLRNGDVSLLAHERSPLRKASPMYNQNHTLSRGENSTCYTPEGSPWGTSISPKLRPKAGGVKTVQTVAGPLLASTRYNIDPKVYSDVTSPGLTTRLTKYATEANNRLTHQSQYGTGQFPKVNLHAGPAPMISTKSAKMRMPVTVRVAPPEVTRYSPPERQQILSSLCHTESKASPSVVQILREISLKRHASSEDVTSALIKKQRTDGIFNEDTENLEETKQKRGRDELSKSEEDLSPQSKTVRPAKRSKTPSCFDIINSLSSSRHVASGVKRKAMDFSRSGTPDFEKHFKPLESTHNSSPQLTDQSQSPGTKQIKQDLNEKYFRGSDVYSHPKKIQDTPPLKGILRIPRKNFTTNSAEAVDQLNSRNIKSVKGDFGESLPSPTKDNLTDKLFMRPEPQRNERFKSLVEEQGNIRAKFTSDEAEEIKKEDIINMRKTSMRARLQSMFDAISGKATSKINPDVVIQAEDVGSGATPVSSPVTRATLNSSTTTTNVNTTPISTSALAPILSPPGPNARTAKHVAFNLPNAESANSSDNSAGNKSATTNNVQPQTVAKPEVAPVTGSQGVSTASPSVNFSTPNLGGSQFSFGKPVAAPAASNRTVSLANSTPSSNATTPTSAIAPTPSVSAGAFGQPAATPSLASGAISATSTPMEKPGASMFGNAKTSTGQTAPGSTTNFTFGTSTATTAASTRSLATPAVAQPAPAQGFTASGGFGTKSTASPATSSSTTNIFSAGTSAGSSAASISKGTPSASASHATSTTPATAAPSTGIFAFGSSGTGAPGSKTETFGFGAPAGNAASASAFAAPTMQVAPAFNNPAPAPSYNFAANAPMSAAAPSASSASAGAFNAITTAATPAFGAPTTSTFSFGAPAQSKSDAKPMFAFEASAKSGPSASAGSTGPCVFGSANSAAPPAFGAPATTAPLGFASGSTSLFGNAPPAATTTATTTSASAFGAPASSMIFGATSTVGTMGGGSFTAAKTTAAPAFGSNAAPMTTTTTTTSSSTGLGMFAGTNANASTTASMSTFGTSSGMFGQAKPPPFGATPGVGGVFGNTATPLFAGQTTTAPPAFGSTNTATSVFGAQSLGMTAPSQNPTTQAFATTTPMFGSENTSTPAFGASPAPASAAGGFGSGAQSAFGGPNTGLAFGAGNAGSGGAFGESKPTPFGAPASAPAFGTPTSSAVAFGSVATSPSGVFSFGGGGGGNQKPAQQNATFAFGSNAGNNAGNSASNNSAVTTSSTPFQFGASTSKPATGFNFTAPSSAPTINFAASGTPTFNAPTPGMFSIGSGSTAPRSRSARPKKTR